MTRTSVSAFFPTSLCGVLVFDSVSRVLSRLPASSRLPPPPLHTHLSHTIFVNHLCQPSSFTHHLSHTISHTPSLTHTHLCQPPSFTPSFTHIFVNHHLSHTIFHTPSLSHTIFHTPSLSTIFVNHHLSHTIFDTHHLSHTPSLTHIFVNHHLSHTIFYTPSLSTTIFHTHTIFVTRNFVTHNLSHTTFHFFHAQSFTHHLSHTIFHAPSLTSSFTHHLSHTIFYTQPLPLTIFVTHLCQSLSHTHIFVNHHCVAGVALGDMCLRFTWQAWPLWHWAGSGGALGLGLVAGDAAAFCVAGVALGDIRFCFTWQAWHLTNTCTLRGRRGIMALGWLWWRGWAGISRQ